MSLSNPKQTNPAQKFIEFKGDKGIFQYWDKTKGENGENVQLTMPFYFMVLDELSTISGYSDKYESSFYSNEVHSLQDEILKVKSFKGGFAVTGLYKDIKNELIASGAKFAKSVYAMLIKGKEDYELVHFKFTGAAFSAWLDKKFSIQQFGVTVKGTVSGKKGSVKFEMPVFEKFNIKQNVLDAAISMDKQLQLYLKDYKAGQLEKMEQQVVAENQIEAEKPETAFEKPGNYAKSVSDVDDLPF